MGDLLRTSVGVAGRVALVSGAVAGLLGLSLRLASPQDPKPDAATGRACDDELKCPGIWYGSTTCRCRPDGERLCACEQCTGGPGCPCLAVLGKGTGEIRGKVESPWFKRIEGCVLVRDVPGRKFALPRVNPVMDQKNLVYTPHVLPILVGSTVDFPNSDEVRHNVYSTKESATVFNLGTYETGTVKRVAFDKVGVASLLCNVHAEMSAYIVVSQNPYFAMVDKQAGTFTIRHVPAGSYKLAVFHEKVSAEDAEVTVTAGATAEVTLKKLTRK